MAIAPQVQSRGQDMKDEIKTWMMVILTVVFVGLYAFALFGAFQPLKDLSIVTRLEPIIFVIIGYYFGRLPSVQNEKALKGEIDRKSGEANDARKEKDAAVEARADQGAKAKATEQKLQDVKTTLATTFAGGPSPQGAAMLSGATRSDSSDAGIRQTVVVALNILNT